MISAAAAYSRMPAPLVRSARTATAIRTSVGATLKYAAAPEQTPVIMRPERVRVRRRGWVVSVGSLIVSSFMSRSCPADASAAIGACPDPSLRDPRSPLGHIHHAGAPDEPPTLRRRRGCPEGGRDAQPRPVERPGRTQAVDQPVPSGR